MWNCKLDTYKMKKKELKVKTLLAQINNFEIVLRE